MRTITRPEGPAGEEEIRGLNPTRKQAREVVPHPDLSGLECRRGFN
ncbi:hypothetical protein [Methanosphaerula subterraneus]